MYPGVLQGRDRGMCVKYKYRNKIDLYTWNINVEIK
jgi:hypothetical protein